MTVRNEQRKGARSSEVWEGENVSEVRLEVRLKERERRRCLRERGGRLKEGGRRSIH